MLSNTEPYITEMAKNHGELAKARDEDIDSGKDTKAFWYWLGYWDGQLSILNEQQIRKEDKHA